MADVLRVGELVRLKLTRNGVTLYDQAYSPVEETYTQHSSDRVVLATNMASPQAVDMGGIGPAATQVAGQHLMIETDRAIKVGVNSQTFLVPVNKALFAISSFTTLYFQNESTTNTATVEYAVTD